MKVVEGRPGPGPVEPVHHTPETMVKLSAEDFERGLEFEGEVADWLAQPLGWKHALKRGR